MKQMEIFTKTTYTYSVPKETHLSSE